MNQRERRLLIVEDESLLRVAMSDALRREGWTVETAEDGVEGEERFRERRPELVLLDLVMPRMDGMELLRRIRTMDPDCAVVMITAHGSVEKAVEAMREGASDFITKPFRTGQLLARLENVYSALSLRRENVRLQEELERRHSFAKIVGKSKEMQAVFDLIRMVADSDASVLVHGESGTGKEMVANAIHYNSPRRSKPYIRVSCASLPETLIESELFGYERGAFTGASHRRAGRFEAADGGTLFLDEISDLPEGFQVKLLRVLQERQFERLGSNKPIDVDVRIVSASQRPLETEIAEGRFREDLYYRINTVAIHVPPLRNRREDIPLLAETFLAEFQRGRDKGIEGFSDEVMDLFDAHPWPGNVRELRNVVERAVLFCRGGHITVDDLPAALRGATPRRRPPAPARREPSTLRDATEQAEIEAIRAALEATEGKRAEAAEQLGISRKTLWEKIKHYGIEDID